MLEQETDRILRSLTEKTIGTRETITLRDALTCGLPRGIRTYLTADVLRSIERDIADAPFLSHVDRSSPGREQLIRNFLLTLTEGYVFPRDEFLDTLDNAVHFLENYLCRPQWTLVSFLFQERDSSPIADILPRLQYFSDYEYFPTLIERSIRRQPANAISLEEFKTFLTRIDDHVVRQHNALELALLTKPMFDFFLLRDARGQDTVPVKALLVFFEDKKMKIMKEYLESIARIRSSSELSLDDLGSLIEDLYSGQTSEVAPLDKPPSPEQPEQRTETTTSEQPMTPLLPDPPTTSETLTPLVENARKNIPLSLTFSGLTERSTDPVAPGKLPDLNLLISSEFRTKFVREIFMNDFAYFGTVIAALNSLRTLDEASAYLEELYDLNGLNPLQAEVKEFVDIIRQRYSGKPEGGA